VLDEPLDLQAETVVEVDGHFEVMAVARDVVAAMVDAVADRAAPAVELLGIELPEVPDEIPWVHYAETGVDDGDLAPEDERRLCGEHGEFVFLTGYPMAKRPFYHAPRATLFPRDQTRLTP
jgi:nondiscriminating aspartyl-tRNA synthetase